MCQKALTHTSTHIYARTHTGRIEYESIAALAGCVPAVTALMLTAADGSVQSRLEQDRSEEEREAKPRSVRRIGQLDGETHQIMIACLDIDIQAKKK